MAILTEEEKKKKLYTPSEQQDTYVEAKPTTTSPVQTQFKPSANVDAAQKYLQSVKDGGYNQQWSQQLDALVNEYMGRGPFSYDQSKDVMWQQAKKTGLDAANLAMRDTTAQAAALSGGYGNSYAATVGQQVYNQGVADVMALAPEYYQAAYQRYKDEGDAMLQNIGLAQSMDETAYARYMDALANAQNEYDTLYNREYGEFIDTRNFDYQAGRDAVADQRYENEWQHGLDREAIEDARYDAEIKYRGDRDAVEDARYADEFAYQKERDSVEDARYDAEWQYQKDRDAVEDARYQAELDYRAERDAVEDGRYQTEQDYKALKEQYDALVKGIDDQAKLEEDAQEIIDRIEGYKTTPKYRNAVTEIKETVAGGVDATEAIRELYDSEYFGNGTEAEEYLLAICGAFRVDIEDVLGGE